VKTTFDAEELVAELAKLGQNPASLALRVYLVRELQRVDPLNAEAGAVLVTHGRRTFAQNLLTLLNANVAEHDYRSGPRPDTQLVGKSQPRAEPQRRGLNRRVGPSEAD
jgi:hypothetical protein